MAKRKENKYTIEVTGTQYAIIRYLINRCQMVMEYDEYTNEYTNNNDVPLSLSEEEYKALMAIDLK